MWGFGLFFHQGQKPKMISIQVSVYKSPKKAELYLYVLQKEQLENLPDELKVMFGKPEHVIDFEISENKKMPRVNPLEAIKSIQKKGYFIQMPPTEIEKLGHMPPPPERLDNIF